MQEVEDTFDVGKIPGVDLTCGGRLHTNGNVIGRILKSDKDEISKLQSLRLTLGAMHSAWLTWKEIAMELFGLAKVYMQASIPHDAEVFCPADPKAEKVVMNFLGHFLKGNSGIHGMDNLAQAMELNAQGESVQFYSVPHQSAVEPVFLKILLQREAETATNAAHKKAAEAMLQQLVVLIGQKVLHSRFRRTFSEAVNGLFTVPPKYRANLEENEKDLLTAHSANIAKIIEYMRSDPRFAMFIFPEGGFTREQQIGFQPMTAQLSKDTYVTPIYMKSPEGFLRPELGDGMYMAPSTVTVYVGKPFTLEAGNIGARISTLVTTCRNNVRAIDAPTGTRQWGFMKRDRQSEVGEKFIPIA
jgi:hypothetical protein